MLKNCVSSPKNLPIWADILHREDPGMFGFHEMSNEGFVAVAHIISRQVVSRDRWLAARNTEERAREVGFECEVFLVVIWGFPKMVGFPNKPMGFSTILGEPLFFWKHPVQAYTGS